MNRAILAYPVAVAETHLADRLRLKGEVLRIPSDDGAIPNQFLAPHDHLPANDGMGLHGATVADLRRPFDDRPGADLDVAPSWAFGWTMAAG